MLLLYCDIFRVSKNLKPSKQTDFAREKLSFASVQQLCLSLRTESSPRTPNSSCRYTDLKRDLNWCCTIPLHGHEFFI